VPVPREWRLPSQRRETFAWTHTNR
jgi:hypothetical protein